MHCTWAIQLLKYLEVSFVVELIHFTSARALIFRVIEVNFYAFVLSNSVTVFCINFKVKSNWLSLNDNAFDFIMMAWDFEDMKMLRFDDLSE